MKMVMTVVPREEAEGVLQALVAAGHTVTFTESRGGTLRQAQLTLFIAVKKEDLPQVLGIIKDGCHSHVTVASGEPQTPFSPSSAPVTTKIGGAVVFVWDLDVFEIY